MEIEGLSTGLVLELLSGWSPSTGHEESCSSAKEKYCESTAAPLSHGLDVNLPHKSLFSKVSKKKLLDVSFDSPSECHCVLALFSRHLSFNVILFL